MKNLETITIFTTENFFAGLDLKNSLVKSYLAVWTEESLKTVSERAQYEFMEVRKSSSSRDNYKPAVDRYDLIIEDDCAAMSMEWDDNLNWFSTDIDSFIIRGDSKNDLMNLIRIIDHANSNIAKNLLHRNLILFGIRLWRERKKDPDTEDLYHL